MRAGTVESVKSEPDDPSLVAIVAGAFRMEENIRKAAGARACLRGTPGEGALVGPFAKMGKCKVRFPAGTDVAAGHVVDIHVDGLL